MRLAQSSLKLGNRSALEWVLDPYKASKPTDKTILEPFNTYRFADYKQKVIELLMRVCKRCKLLENYKQNKSAIRQFSRIIGENSCHSGRIAGLSFFARFIKPILQQIFHHTSQKNSTTETAKREKSR